MLKLFTFLIKKKIFNILGKFTGQILHTIQDFYSHSNWVEMNMTTINSKIGWENFSSSNPPFIDNTTSACNTSCTITQMGCGKLVTLLISLVQLVGLGKTVQCPVQYYKCEGNIIALNQLVSGYYSGQHLDNGVSVDKPTGLSKCSHGKGNSFLSYFLILTSKNLKILFFECRGHIGQDVDSSFIRFKV